jgi:NADH-quinone oxidoreductase subunit J
MIVWVFGAAALLSGTIAASLENTRRSILFLWSTGMLCGGMFLCFNCELLAVVQWIVSTAVCLSLLHFSTLLGEYTLGWKAELKEKAKLKLIPLLSLPIAAGFAVLIGRGSLGEGQSLPAPALVDLHSLGQAMSSHYMLPIEVLGLTILITVVGGGVIARQE